MHYPFKTKENMILQYSTHISCFLIFDIFALLESIEIYLQKYENSVTSKRSTREKSFKIKVPYTSRWKPKEAWHVTVSQPTGGFASYCVPLHRRGAVMFLSEPISHFRFSIYLSFLLTWLWKYFYNPSNPFTEHKTFFNARKISENW